MTRANGMTSFAADFDFTDPDVLVHGVPTDEFAELRSTAPLFWNEQRSEHFGDGGYWVVSRHRDIAEVTRDGTRWSTALKGSIIGLPESAPIETVRATTSLLMVNQEGDAHTRLRTLVSRLFTPRALAVMEARLTASARRIVVQARERGSGDFVDDVAMRLPVQAIAELLGVPDEDRSMLYALTNSVMYFDDPDADDLMEASALLVEYAYGLAEQRRRQPQDDIVTRLIAPRDDGDGLEDMEFALFVILLAIAGNETTRNALSAGMHAFIEHPEQWELFRRLRPASAVEEVLRWATPVHCTQRTAIVDTELSGTPIRAGDRVGLFYSSANFDESVFTDPHRFDILRDPNPHLTFGGKGVHYCLGANLARLEVRLIFDAIADLAPDITKLADPVRARSGWLNGFKRFEVGYR